VSREWAVFLEPQTWIFLGGGVLVTLQVAAVTIVISLVTGTLLALARVSSVGALRLPSSAYIDVIRGIPVFLIIIFTFFGLGRAGIVVSVAWSVTVALTIYATAQIAEIVRAGIQAVPRGQIDAARALGLNPVQTLRYVVYPQAFRMMVPALAGQYIILTKSTAIGAVIGLDEVLRRAVILYNGYQNPLQSLFVAGCIYFVLLFSLSRLSRRLEPRHATMSVVHEAEESWLSRLAPARRFARAGR
jgi:His/Glu/Gln/Arg/opine family amino acid ABC transporter permease subunit